MLTADLARVFRRQGELKLRAIDAKTEARARELAASYIEILEHSLGDTRAEVFEALAAVSVSARDRKLADGLRKLLLDRCEFDSVADVEPAELRAEVFARAAALRREGRLDREALLAEIAADKGVDGDLERLLYADLKEAQRLLRFEAPTPAQLVAAYQLGQVQAVLLKAESVVFEVHCADPAIYRLLFRKMKFHRLLHTIEPTGAGYRIHVDGPFSLFSSVTKYGLQLAMVVPAVRACDRWSLEAVVRWGKDKSRLRFRAQGVRDGDVDAPRLPDEVERLVRKWEQRFADGKTPWKVAPATQVLSLPGVGVCVPDLEFRRGEDAVLLEVLGFWSRQAVWKRVELVESGLDTPIVFAVPERLRVSEEVLPADLPGALYTYKGVMSAKAIEERLERVAG